MPNAYIKKLADQGKGSVVELEKKWSQAKAIAAKDGKGDNFALITSIFKKMAGLKENMLSYEEYFKKEE